MVKTRVLQFNLKIKGQKDRLTFFSLPKTNKYQTISHLRYAKKNFIQAKDKNYNNEILILNKDSEEYISFKAVLKSIEKPILQDVKGKFIYNDSFVGSKDFKVKQLAKKLKGKTVKDTIINTYQFVVEYLEYGYPYKGLYPYSQALRDRITDCGGFSTFLMSLLSANKINSRLVVGYLVKNNRTTKLLTKLPAISLTFDNLYMHVWVEAEYLSNLWLTLDPSLEKRRAKGLTTRKGGLENLAADRLVLSFGHNLQVFIKKKKYTLPILQDPINIKI